MKNDAIGKQFCAALNEEFERRFGGERGKIQRFADLIGFSYSQTANMLKGVKTSTESKRRDIAERLGLVYDDMIGMGSASRIGLSVTAGAEIIRAGMRPETKTALEHARRILESDSPLSGALATVIDAFHRIL